MSLAHATHLRSILAVFHCKLRLILFGKLVILILIKSNLGFNRNGAWTDSSVSNTVLEGGGILRVYDQDFGLSRPATLELLPESSSN
jgi:hypothetical protein